MNSNRHQYWGRVAWLAGAGLLALMLAPLVVYFLPLFSQPATIAHAFISDKARLAGLLLRTVQIALVAATLASALALACVGAAETLSPRGRVMALALAFAAFTVPGHFLAIGWIQAVGYAGWITALLGGENSPRATWLPALLYTPLGCAMVMGIRYYPIALALLLAARGAGASPALEATAGLVPPARLWRAVAFGWLRPWIAAGWLAVFVLALLDYSIPSLLRQQVFTVEIMSAFNLYYDGRQAMALALPLTGVAALAAWALGPALRRVQWSGPARRAQNLLPSPPAALAWMLRLAALATLAGALLLPLATLAGMTGGLEPFRMIFGSAQRQIGISLAVGFAAALLALGVAALLVLPGIWKGGKPRLLDALMLALFALPGALVGIAEIEFWNTTLPGPLGRAMHALLDGGGLLPLGLATLILPIAWLALRTRQRELPRAWVDQQRMAPAATARRNAALLWPLFARPAFAAVGLLLLLAMQEAQAAILLAAPGQETLSIRALTLLHYAPDSLVAAFCLVSLASMLAGVALVQGAWLLLIFLMRRFARDHALA